MKTLAELKKETERLKPYSEEWERLANRLARSYCPSIRPCHKCHYPVVHGYCCTHCGDTNPESDD